MSDDLAVVRDLLRATPGETLVQQVQGLLVALHAEQHRCGDLEAVLASERGDASGAPTKGWEWDVVHVEWRKQMRHVKLWVHRKRDEPGWVCAGGNTWHSDNILYDEYENTAHAGMHLMDKRVRDYFESA